jgi:CRP-like cAMP-binding protein
MRLVGPLERALYLKTLPAFEGLGSAEIAAFAEHAIECRYRRGATVLKAGEPVTAFHVVVDGKLLTETPKDSQPAEAGPRATAGLLSLLARSTKGIKAIAIEDTLTLSLEADVVFDLLEDNFAIFLQFLRYLARRTLEERMDTPEWELLAPAQDEAPVQKDLTIIDRLLYVKRPGTVFEHSSLAAVADMVAMTHELRFPAGTTLWTSGDRSDEAFIIVGGIVLCTIQGTLTPFRCGPGYPLGNLERLCGEPRWYTAVTETEVVALRSDLDPFLDVLEDYPDMAKDLLIGMARNLIRILRENAEARETRSSPDGEPTATEFAQSEPGIPS